VTSCCCPDLATKPISAVLTGSCSMMATLVADPSDVPGFTGTQAYSRPDSSKDTRSEPLPNNGARTQPEASTIIRSDSRLSNDADKPKATPHAQNSGVAIIDRFIDEPRQIGVAVIGGGLAGILAGVLLPTKVPGIKLTIFEKNADFVWEQWPG